MKILSVNVGLPREVSWQGKLVTTGIFKEPVNAPVMLRTLNLDGDQQADLTVHGGVDKAVYAYPSEHYHYWRAELPGVDLTWGMFGENFTTEGLLEEAVYIGDRFRVEETEVMVTEPRMPCYKLGIKFSRADIIKRFLASRRTGFYFAVVREGMVGTGDAIKFYWARATRDQCGRCYSSLCFRKTRCEKSSPSDRSRGVASELEGLLSTPAREANG